MLPMIETDLTNSNPVQTCFALSIVIPVYNGARSIADLVRALEHLSIAGGHEIVLVNDGSADDSLAVCHALFDKARVPVTLVNLARNHGEHNAVMAGLRYATGAHVITMDDDLQNPPEEVERLLAYSQRSGKEVVYTYYDDKRHAAWRNLASRFTNRVAEFVLDKPRGMYLSSFRCMSAFVVREITRYEGPFPYVDGLILQVTQDIDRLLVAHLPRTAGHSNDTLRRLLRLWMSMFVNFSVMPLRISTLAGLVLSVLGAIGGAMAMAEALSPRRRRAGPR
jgi:glycosyltransferase involved in cell wall biosynthesis